MESVYPNLESSRVVELVDCLGDTVVRVRHLETPERKRFAALYLPLALLCFMVAGGSFFSAVGTASENKEALHAHIAGGAPAHSFRPKTISAAHSWGAGLSALAGLALTFAFFAGRGRKESTAQGFDDSHEGAFDMVSVSDDGAQVVLPASMRVSVQSPSELLDAETLCARGQASRDALGWLRLTLDDTASIRAEQGQRVVHMRWTPKPKSKTFVAGLAVDSRFAAYVGASATAALLVLAVLRNLPVEESTLFGDDFADSERFVAMSTVPWEEAISEPDEGDAGEGGDTQPAEASEAGALGTTGIETATATEAKMQIKNRNTPPQPSREQVRSSASHSGILGQLREQQLFASVTASSNFASGDGMQDWYGGINGGPVGHQVGELSGSWGNDVTGMGQWGTVKVGNRLGRLAMSGGTCETVGCDGTGFGGDSMRKHKASKPVFKVGPVDSSGGLDHSIIRRHIKRNKLRIQHCYEKRLLAAPTLAGTLTASFSIGANGKVIGSTASGMSDAPLQDCVADVVSSIAFPSTTGGSVVNVRYPFTFHSAED